MINKIISLFRKSSATQPIAPPTFWTKRQLLNVLWSDALIAAKAGNFSELGKLYDAIETLERMNKAQYLDYCLTQWENSLIA